MKVPDYANDLNAQFTYLIEWARAISELDMAGALFGEFRGMQGPGWSTTITAYEVNAELKALATKGAPLTVPEFRQVLCLYAQLAEAGGVYESISNLMGVVQNKPYSLWPFRDLVRVRQSPKRVIGPNSNAMFRRLAQTAIDIGMPKLASLLETAFRDDIRNGMFHADYIIANDGLRLRRRNGGQVIVVPYDELERALSIGLAFFDLLDVNLREARETFRPARKIIGRFSANPPMEYTVELGENGQFSISTKSPGAQTNPAYERQERINAYLGGRVFAAFASGAGDEATSLLEEIQLLGFDVPLVVLGDEQKLTQILDEVDQYELSRAGSQSIYGENSLLLATPSGFARISSVTEFQALLPEAGAVEFT
ncbi:MAG: hypothetical protein K2Y27_31700 [Xanthobacteraceae bacterium]|nr:hypothetical protein [Xanthobacteraceae bacterium]